jgi:hypothetical protein
MITFRALLATGFTLLASMPAPAQTVQQPPRPERPYRGIFAGGMNDSGQSLTGQATLSGGYDDNVLAQATNRANSSIRDSQEGSFGQFTGGLNYALTGDRGSVNAMAGTSQRYYPSLQNDYFKTYQASLGGMVRVTTKPEITLNQSVAYRPYTFLDVLPSAIEPPTISCRTTAAPICGSRSRSASRSTWGGTTRRPTACRTSSCGRRATRTSRWA